MKTKLPSLFAEDAAVDTMEKDAKFSDCGKYRFWLSRIWENRLPKLMLIGLNPSTANAETDDPTIRSIIRIVGYNGFGGFYMTNLFPYITPKPSELDRSDKMLDYNDHILMRLRIGIPNICFCWGTFDVLGRDKVIKELFPHASCLGMNKDGSPKHPLFLKTKTDLIPYIY